LLRGTPIDLGKSDAGTVPTGTVGQEEWPKERVTVRTLLCGPEALVLTVTPHIPAAKPEAPVRAPIENVTLTVKLPNFLRRVTAFEATEEGIVPFPCEVRKRRAELQLENLAWGRVFVLRKK